MPDERYAGLNSDQADTLMCNILSDVVREELRLARDMPDEEWNGIDLKHRCDTIAGVVWCVLQNRLGGAPFELFPRRIR
jgi:hypothetical protein